MRTSIAVAISVVAALAAAASAKPLPKGMKVAVKDPGLAVTIDGVTVPAFPPGSYTGKQHFGELKKAELSDDGKTLLIYAQYCGEDGTEAIEIAMADIEARVENTLGMQHHLKKKYADAITHFTTAASKDPDTPVYATNLLSAQALANQLDDADKTIATYAPKHRGWFAWRLAVDPELVRLRGRASTKSLSAPPSKLTSKTRGDALVISPLGMYALDEWTGGGMGIPQVDLVVSDLATGKQLFDQRVQDFGSCGPEGVKDDPMGLCDKAASARTPKYTKAIDATLAALAFQRVATEWVSVDYDATTTVSPDKSTTITYRKDMKIAVARGKQTKVIDSDRLPKSVGFAGKYVILKFRGVSDCMDGDAQYSHSTLVTFE